MAAMSAKRKFQLFSITIKYQKPCQQRTLRLSTSTVLTKSLDLDPLGVRQRLVEQLKILPTRKFIL